jgi:hypothetical protein
MEQPMIGRLALAAVGIVAAISGSAAEPLPIKEGQTFVHARAKLIGNGWKPIETFARYPDGELERDEVNARILFEVGFREVGGCMGTGTNPCFFSYHKGNRCMLLITEGEYDPRIPNSSEVTGWWVYPVPAKKVSEARPQYPFCSEDAANKTRHHVGRAY